MMLYPYLNLVGAQGIFATCTGGPARRYGDLAVLTTATLGFALGAGTVEGTKHLRRAEAGAAVGLVATPELGTLRARLSALADNADPLGLQRAFAAGMLAADPAADTVYFVVHAPLRRRNRRRDQTDLADARMRYQKLAQAALGPAMARQRRV